MRQPQETLRNLKKPQGTFKMKVLVIGQGGREHCIVRALKRSKLISKLYAAPGNAGIAHDAACVAVPSGDIEGLLRFANDQKIDYTVVGPEQPLADGIVDRFKKEKLNIFGPVQKAAILESSKVTGKKLLKTWKIPTADFKVFSDYEDAKKHLEKTKFPLVIKADGLCQGKGVIVCRTKADAETALRQMMQDKVFGTAAEEVIVEDFLEGEELSVIALSDGKQCLCFPPSQDHKRVFDNDQGLNTGGMGAYSPVPVANDTLLKRVEHEIIKKTIDGMYRDVAPFKGFLYAGLMITKNGEPYVLEYNVRLGDPETQVLLPRLKSDFFELILNADKGELASVKPQWDSRACVCVVIASAGYPGPYQKGLEIKGLDTVKDKNVLVFHAGTAFDVQKRIVTAGGRVLNVAALSDSIVGARDKAYGAIESIRFEGMQYRKDIGSRAVNTDAG